MMFGKKVLLAILEFLLITSLLQVGKVTGDVTSGRTEHVVSEPIPETQGNLKVAVAKNFRELIADADKDALIEFYAPWCGHCKVLAPKYEELADKLKDEDVIVAKMDVTANDLPDGYEVRGVPTIYWLPKNTKVPIKYEGPRGVNDLFNFVVKHSTDGIENHEKTGEKALDEKKPGEKDLDKEKPDEKDLNEEKPDEL